MTYLFKNPIIKKLLELLIAVIDAKLLKAVEFIIFCTKGKQNITSLDDLYLAINHDLKRLNIKG